MPQAMAQATEVSEREKSILEGITRRPTAPQGLVTRARIMLQASRGETNTGIARELKITRNTVRAWRERWQVGAERRAAVAAESESDQALEAVLEDHLRDAYRSGAPAKFSAEQVVQIIAIACEDPQTNGYPISHWTPREVAAEAIKRGIVTSISERQVGRFLK